jgi:hypothetical protein
MRARRAPVPRPICVEVWQALAAAKSRGFRANSAVPEVLAVLVFAVIVWKTSPGLLIGRVSPVFYRVIL